MTLIKGKPLKSFKQGETSSCVQLWRVILAATWTLGKERDKRGARNPIVMVNYMCQPDWAKGCPDSR